MVCCTFNKGIVHVAYSRRPSFYVAHSTREYFLLHIHLGHHFILFIKPTINKVFWNQHLIRCKQIVSQSILPDVKHKPVIQVMVYMMQKRDSPSK